VTMRLMLAALLVTATPVAAQTAGRIDTVIVRVSSHSSRVDTIYMSRTPARDTADILTAAREWVGKRDSTVAQDEIEIRADTALVMVWVRASRSGREGAKVRVERRAGQWVAVQGSRSEIMVIRP
jgi:hypothetical protein